MKKLDASADAPIPARVVHKSVFVDQSGVSPVFKLMLNVSRHDAQFIPGANIGFAPPSPDAGDPGGRLRYFTIESVGEVPFEDTLDITLYVRKPLDNESADAARMLTTMKRGDVVDVFGPAPYPFYPPMGSRSNMVMIGAGCGMVPFRWLALKIHERQLDWMGKVLMLHGPGTGLEHIYANHPNTDKDQYFDKPTYRAFEALKTRYSAHALDHGESALANMEALWRLLGQGSVFVYLAGYRRNARSLDDAMAKHLRLADRWMETKKALIRDGHWLEYLYD